MQSNSMTLKCENGHGVFQAVRRPFSLEKGLYISDIENKVRHMWWNKTLKGSES